VHRIVTRSGLVCHKWLVPPNKNLTESTGSESTLSSGQVKQW